MSAKVESLKLTASKKETCSMQNVCVEKNREINRLKRKLQQQQDVMNATPIDVAMRSPKRRRQEEEKEPPEQENPQMQHVLMAPKKNSTSRKKYRDFFEPFTPQESALARTDRAAFMALSVKKGKEALARRMQSPPPLKPGEKKLTFKPDTGAPCGNIGSVGLTFSDCSGSMSYIFPKCDHEYVA